MTAGTQDFTSDPVSLLAIFACPHRLGGAPALEDPAKLVRRASLDREGCEAQALQKAEPSARVLLWPDTFHVFFFPAPQTPLGRLTCSLRV